MIKKFLFAALLVITPTLAVDAYAQPANGAKAPAAKKVVVIKESNFDVPSQKIEGAESPIDLGEVIMLNLSKIDKVPKDFASYTVEWKVYDKGVEKKFFKTNDGTGIFFGSGITKRKITVFAAVSYLYVIKDGDKLVEAGVKSQFLTATVSVGGVAPGPDPIDPVDPDVVDPTFPDGTFKLAALSYKLGKAVPATAKGGAKHLAKSFSSQAAKIAAGQELLTANDIKKVLEETTEANRKALKDNSVDTSAWNDYFTALQDEIFELYSNDKLKTKSDFATAWREISSGLEAVK